MTTTDKDTVYIDIDDEITGIIDKLRTSPGKVVALVLPKRAAVFQSIVNMKLLKRAADAGNKHLVLITAEAGLLPLAGAAGIHVARTLTSKPEIPPAPGLADDREESIDETGALEPEVTAANAGDEPVGKLAGFGATANSVDEGVETLVLDDEALPPEADAAAAAAKNFDPPAKGKGKGGKKTKGLHVPNFERFRLLLILGVLALILLIGGLVSAMTILPKARITIDTNAINVDSDLELNLSTAAKTLNTEDETVPVVPAKLVQQQKTYVQQAPATGQKNTGNKASGDVTITNCNKDGSAVSIPAGTGVSANGQTYITQASVYIEESLFQGQNGPCRTTGSTSETVNVIAQGPGSGFNINSGTTVQIAGYANVNAKTASSISGGTDNIVQIVTQADINTAKAKIVTTDPTVKQALHDQLTQTDYFAIDATYSAGTPNTTTSASVGDTASSVTVTEIVTHTMFGVKDGDLKKLVQDDVKSQIDPKQNILSEGLDKAKFAVKGTSATGAEISLSTVAKAGPDLDVKAIKRDAAGQKSGPIKDELQQLPGVRSVNVSLSPFWVSSVPKETDKITVIIAEPKTSASQRNDR